MNDEQRLSDDELEAIQERYLRPINYLSITDAVKKPLTEIAGELNTLKYDIAELFIHIQAIENELAIERAQVEGLSQLPGSRAIDDLYEINGIVGNVIGDWQMIETETTIDNVRALANAYKRLLDKP